MATNVATPFPKLDLQPGSIITVTLDDAAADITQLVIHGRQEAFIPGTNIPAPVLLTTGGVG